MANKTTIIKKSNVAERMKDGTEKYANMVNYFSELYDFLNDTFFESALSKPVITISPDEKGKASGWFVCGEIWTDGEKKAPEINMTSNFLNRTALETATTLLHEMCHQYAYDNGIQDCSRSGNYHNKHFAEIGENHGLHVEKVPVRGWSKTSFQDTAKTIVEQYVMEHPTTCISRELPFKGQLKKSSSTRKYVCPVCGVSVRATKEVKILCEDCDERMLLDD